MFPKQSSRNIAYVSIILSGNIALSGDPLSAFRLKTGNETIPRNISRLRKRLETRAVWRL